MSDINTTTLTGRLVRDPILRQGESGISWGVFTIASNHQFKDKGGAFQEVAAFVPCKVFGRLAELLARHKRGETAIVTGRLKTDTWEKDGRNQSQLTLVCDMLRFVVLQNGSSTPASVVKAGPASREDDNDDPPF